MLASTTKIASEWYEMWMLCSKPETNLSINSSSVLSQLYSLEQKFQKNLNLRSLYQQSIHTDIDKRFADKFVSKKEWQLLNHAVLNQYKPGKSAFFATLHQYKEVRLNDIPFAGADLLHWLIGKFSNERSIALTADMKSMRDIKKCKFFNRINSDKRMLILRLDWGIIFD